jgi:8-oxo-dGTP pyrophosphatase MutT (NUDIX family)
MRAGKQEFEKMDGMSRKELDRAEARDMALGKGPLRPVDAATLILLDRRDGIPHVLIGRRHSKHAFMPGKFVFPGGRTDPTDARVVTADDLEPVERNKLMAGPGRRASAARARAIALSAIRETYEEAGYLIGHRGQFATNNPAWREFSRLGVIPALAGLRFVARAITPPGRVRRFDTRFLAVFTSSVAVELEGGGPTHELQELLWLPVHEAMEADVPTITRTVLQELAQRLELDPDLKAGAAAVPYFHLSRNRFRRDVI